MENVDINMGMISGCYAINATHDHVMVRDLRCVLKYGDLKVLKKS